MSDARFCIACKHYRLDRNSTPGNQHRCNRPNVDPVTGESRPHDLVCAAERGIPGTTMQTLMGDNCGPSGRFWEPRT